MIYPVRKKFSLDGALRYYPVVKMLDSLADNTEPVLEVGSGVNGISDFFGGNVIGVDSDFGKTVGQQNKNIVHKLGSVAKIPFKDGSFKYVVCMDTFEHIKDEIREKSFKELYRVTKKGGLIFLGFPSSALSQKYEDVLSFFYKKKYKRRYYWLEEHKLNGLPDESKIQKIISKRFGSKKKISLLKYVNLNVWLISNLIFVVYPDFFLFRILKLFYKPIFIFLKLLRFGPFYRVLFIVEK